MRELEMRGLRWARGRKGSVRMRGVEGVGASLGGRGKGRIRREALRGDREGDLRRLSASVDSAFES